MGIFSNNALIQILHKHNNNLKNLLGSNNNVKPHKASELAITENEHQTDFIFMNGYEIKIMRFRLFLSEQREKNIKNSIIHGQTKKQTMNKHNTLNTTLLMVICDPRCIVFHFSLADILIG